MTGQQDPYARFARRAPWLTALAMAGLLCLPLGGHGESAPSVEQMRQQMRELQAEREAREPLEGLIELKTLTTALNLEEARGRAALRLVRNLDAFNVVWIFEPVDADEGTATVVMPQCLDGSQWIALERGLWRVSLIFGRPDQPQTWRLPPREIQLLRGRAYGIEIGQAAGKAMQTIERETARENRQKP